MRPFLVVEYVKLHAASWFVHKGCVRHGPLGKRAVCHPKVQWDGENCKIGSNACASLRSWRLPLQHSLWLVLKSRPVVPHVHPVAFHPSPLHSMCSEACSGFLAIGKKLWALKWDLGNSCLFPSIFPCFGIHLACYMLIAKCRWQERDLP